MKVMYSRSAVLPDAQMALPWLSVRVHGRTTSVKIEMLVDSGAGWTALPRFIVEGLGIEVAPEPVHILGVGGAITGHKGRGRFTAGGVSFEADFLATDDPIPV